jgi:hypothetical protein
VTTRFVGNRTLSAAEAMCSRPASVRVGGFAFIRMQLSRCRLLLSASGPLMLVQAVPQPGDQRQDFGEYLPRHRDLS